MIAHQMDKVVTSIPTTVGTNAVTLTIDTRGWDHASISVLRASNSATAFASVLKIEQSDDDSDYANLSGFVGGTDFTIPTVTDTSSAAVVKMDVDTKTKKRYLKVTATPSASMNAVITARLSRGENAPSTAAEAGCVGWVKG